MFYQAYDQRYSISYVLTIQLCTFWCLFQYFVSYHIRWYRCTLFSYLQKYLMYLNFLMILGLIKIKWKFLDLLQKKSIFGILNMTSRFCHQHTLWATAFLSRLLNLYYADTLSWTMRLDRTVFLKYASLLKAFFGLSRLFCYIDLFSCNI